MIAQQAGFTSVVWDFVGILCTHHVPFTLLLNILIILLLNILIILLLNILIIPSIHLPKKHLPINPLPWWGKHTTITEEIWAHVNLLMLISNYYFKLRMVLFHLISLLIKIFDVPFITYQFSFIVKTYISIPWNLYFLFICFIFLLMMLWHSTFLFKINCFYLYSRKI